MTLVRDDPSSALQEKKESQGLISIQSMVTCGHAEEDDIFDYQPSAPLEETSSESSENVCSSDALLNRVASRLERRKSCESVGSMSDESHEEEEEDSSLTKEDAGGGVGCERSTSVVSDATSEEGGRDSGIENEKDADLPPMVPPDEALIDKIVAQVEFYFSDSNVAKDKFLLKHIRRNKEGYVSLKLVSSFKKVKQLTKDWRVVAHALAARSALVAVNDQKTKIRRVEPLPEIDDAPVTSAVLALDLPLDKPSVETVSKLFGAIGEIAFVRVLRAGGNLPPDIKSLMTKYPVLGEKHCAWIEFETPEAAKAAAAEMTVEDGMRVVLIVPESQKKQEKQKQSTAAAASRKNSAAGKHKAPNSRKNSSSNGSNHYKNYYNNNIKPPRKDSNNQDREGRRYPQQHLQQRRKAISLPSSQNPFLSDPNGRTEARRMRPKSKSCTEFSSSGGSPPTSWVQRHLLAAAAASAASAASPVIGSRPPSARLSRVSVGSLPLSESVVRLPKGPDGSRGFACREMRLRQISETPA